MIDDHFRHVAPLTRSSGRGVRGEGRASLIVSHFCKAQQVPKRLRSLRADDTFVVPEIASSRCPGGDSPLWAAQSKRAQKIKNVLFPALRERLELTDHGIGFRRITVGWAAAAMRRDREQQVSRASVVQEINPLPDTP
jgi:hypothetical protein